MDIEADRQQHLFTTWLENLRLGALYMILHPFFPFLKSTSFNFRYLFPEPGHHSNTTHPTTGDSLISQGYPSFWSGWYANLTNNAQIVRRGKSVESEYLPRLIPVQLLLCSLALSYYLIKEVRFVIRHLRAII